LRQAEGGSQAKIFSLERRKGSLALHFNNVHFEVGAFGSLSTTGAADPAQLAGDIQIALLTTFWGLLTAIPSLISYFYFKNKLNNLVAEAHHSSEELINASIQTVNQDAYLAKIPEGIAV